MMGTLQTLFHDYGAKLGTAICQHTAYVLVSVVIGFAVGLVLGILLSRIPRWLSGFIIPVLSIFQTIPGLVFIGVLFIWWGNIYPTVIVAMPVIVAGVRMAAIYTVSWAVLASMISLGGLGDFVYQGTSSNNNTLILLGAIPAAILAILFGAVIDLLQKKVTPRGLRKGAGK